LDIWKTNKSSCFSVPTLENWQRMLKEMKDNKEEGEVDEVVVDAGYSEVSYADGNIDSSVSQTPDPYYGAVRLELP
jgi:tellurite resistance protein